MKNISEHIDCKGLMAISAGQSRLSLRNSLVKLWMDMLTMGPYNRLRKCRPAMYISLSMITLHLSSSHQTLSYGFYLERHFSFIYIYIYTFEIRLLAMWKTELFVGPVFQLTGKLSRPLTLFIV
jgi:hypothetical protein